MEYFGINFAEVFWKFIFPPSFYAFHGYIATEMAIWALFHPYEAWYFPFTRVQVPCTPGIFPKRRAKLAQAVAATVTDTLLTATDIKAQAENLVTERNIYVAVDAIIDSIMKEFRDTTKLHRLAADLSELTPTALDKIVVALLEGVESGKDTRIAAITEKVFDHVVLTARISLDQANLIAGRLMESFLTPQRIRSALISLLSPQNINALDESIQTHAGGPYKFLARILGVKRICYEWRNYLEKEPEQAHKLISDLVKRFGIRDQIAVQIANFDMRTLPLQTVNRFRENLVTFVQAFLVEHRQEILDLMKRIQDESMGTVRLAIIKFNPEEIPNAWLARSKQNVASFCYAYLQRELGELLERAIPALGMYNLIARKIDLFTPQQLEAVIKRICKQELHWLALLGGFIGAWLGLVQIAVNWQFMK